MLYAWGTTEGAGLARRHELYFNLSLLILSPLTTEANQLPAACDSGWVLMPSAYPAIQLLTLRVVWSRISPHMPSFIECQGPGMSVPQVSLTRVPSNVHTCTGCRWDTDYTANFVNTHSREYAAGTFKRNAVAVPPAPQVTCVLCWCFGA